MIIDDIRELAQAPDFRSFSIEMNDGRSIKVPSRDHIGAARRGVYIEHDDGKIYVLFARNIAGITFESDEES
jgi:hypothetical protein